MNPQQKNCRCKNFFASERAVSTTLAFVIITGILISTFAILMAVQVPQWTKETEATHAAKVPLSFAELDSVIDMAILRDDSSSSGCRLDMMPESVPAVGVHASAGMLEFNSSIENEKFCFMACAPFEVAPDDNTTHWWNSTPSNFSDANYTKFQVVKQDYGAELALEFSEGDMIYDSSGDEELAGAFRCNKFAVTGSTTLYTSNLIIYARNITIGPNAKIDADGRGSAGGIQNHNGTGGGPGQNNVNNNCTGGGGGGHGGAGGAGGNSTHGDGGAGGGTYGAQTDDKEALAGSGGGGGSTGVFGAGGSQIIAGGGGNGGGYMFLHARDINIAGELSVDGTDGGNGGGGSSVSAGGGGGGGSGGCILIKGDNVTVSGDLYANGGDGGNGGSGSEPGGGGGGGAGGRIKIFNNSDPDFSGIYYEVNGGDRGSRGGSFNGTKHGTVGAPGCVTSAWMPYTPHVYHYATGWLESCVFDNPNKTSLVHYGIMIWNTTTDADTNIIMKVRTSINNSMDENITMSWGDCPPVVNGTDISDLPSVSDGNQYIQWRAEFITFDLSKTPVLQWVNISYEYGVPFIVNTSGSIRYSSQYTDLRNFELVYAQGATIKNQTEGVLMVSDPSISISNKGNFTELIITAINLTGSNKTLSGGSRATIKPSDTNSELITGGLYYTNLTINITTDYLDVWEKWFNDTCKDAGLDFGTNAGNYKITKNGNRVQIAFYGDETRPVKIWLKSAETEIEMRGEG